MNIKDISPKLRNERQLKAVTGLSSEQFSILLVIFESLLNIQMEKNKDGKIKPNNGKIGILKTPSDKLFFVLYYLKCYPVYDQFGFIFDMSGSSAYTWLYKIMPVFIETLAQLNILPKTKFETPEEMKEAFKDFETLVIDATERAIQRPQDNEAQEDHYSGKKKKHTIKNTIIASLDFIVLYVGVTFSGKNHDYGMFKKEFNSDLNWFSSFNVLIDLGYTGFGSDYEIKTVEIPHKKPYKTKNNTNPELTKKQKEENREMSRKRVIVENVIGGMKRFRCISDRYRNHITELKNLFILLAAGLWNFNMAYRN